MPRSDVLAVLCLALAVLAVVLLVLVFMARPEDCIRIVIPLPARHGRKARITQRSLVSEARADPEPTEPLTAALEGTGE
jgi:hypothetical protein